MSKSKKKEDNYDRVFDLLGDNRALRSENRKLRAENEQLKEDRARTVRKLAAFLAGITKGESHD